jgi:hypothetical protein
MPARPALFAAVVLTAGTLSASFPAAADTPPAPSPSAPLAPTVLPLAPLLERRSAPAFTGGAAAVTLGGVLLLSSALAAGLQAACDAHCDHTPTVIGMVSAGSALLAAGIPLILWGGKLVPRRPLPAWAGAPGNATRGWAFRF